MLNRYYGRKGQPVELTQEDYDILTAADDRSDAVRGMIAGDARDAAYMRGAVAFGLPPISAMRRCGTTKRCSVESVRCPRGAPAERHITGAKSREQLPSHFDEA